MSIIVQKFGGTSVMNADRIKNVARIVSDTYRKGNQVVVVVSAQGHTTDELIDKAKELSNKPSHREMDMLMASGEQISIALVAIAIEQLGIDAISFTGWQAGISTDLNYSNAKIRNINVKRIISELEDGKVVIVAGFQGLNSKKDITTLGRGGSDTSAVALASCLGAEKCQIFTDVEGVYTCDPRIITSSQKLDEISYDEMLELALSGAVVLHNRSVEIAKRYGVVIEVLSSFEKKSGTLIYEDCLCDSCIIKGIAKDDRYVLISVEGAEGLFEIFLSNSIDFEQGSGNNFIISQVHLDNAIKIMYSMGLKYLIDEDCCKISIVATGILKNPSTMNMITQCLSNINTKVKLTLKNDIRISVIVKKDLGNCTLRELHNIFFESYCLNI